MATSRKALLLASRAGRLTTTPHSHLCSSPFRTVATSPRSQSTKPNAASKIPSSSSTTPYPSKSPRLSQTGQHASSRSPSSSATPSTSSPDSRLPAAAANYTTSSTTSSSPSTLDAPSSSPPSPVVFAPQPTLVDGIPTVDWSESYYGVGAVPLSQEQYKSLSTPVDVKDIEVKPDGIIYLPEIKYRRRLNDAFGPMGWGVVPRGEATVGDNIVTREYALIVNGRFASQAQGENNYFTNDQIPSAVEGCKSNALMRCCKDLGIASELWDPQFVKKFRAQHMVSVWVEHLTTKKKRTLWFKKGEVDVQYPFKKSGGD